LFGTVAPEELPNHGFDGGIAYFVSNNVKLDLSGGFELSPDSFKNYVALGFPFRIPFENELCTKPDGLTILSLTSGHLARLSLIDK